ncbi:MAG: hypothetical protein GY827_04670 [Cytophagales bacterium]|nr:hypothetical protein [Cytophagales bacterium]
MTLKRADKLTQWMQEKIEEYESLPNPNPNNYKVIRHYQSGKFLLVELKYLDCTNYEGNKIMLYKDCTMTQLLEQKLIDPHFSNNPNYYSPIARFEPTDEGWNLATNYINMLWQQKTKK